MCQNVFVLTVYIIIHVVIIHPAAVVIIIQLFLLFQYSNCYSWQRIVRTRLGETSGPTRVDICYVTPCKRRLRTFPEIQRYIDQNDIANLTIQNFSFSKKVNVGVVINEDTLINNTKEELTRPRRGRPPKHLKAMKEIEENKERIHDKKEVPIISLEPHEIGHQAYIDREKVIGLSVSGKPAKPDVIVTEKNSNEILKFVQSPGDRQLSTDTTNHFPVPHMVRIDANDESVNAAKQVLDKERGHEERRGWKRKSTVEEGDNKPVFKKPRGRPKGTGSTGEKCTCVLYNEYNTCM